MPAGPHFLGVQKPLTVTVYRFEQKQAVFRKTIPHAYQRIFQNQRTEFRFAAAELGLEVQLQSGFALQNDVEPVPSLVRRPEKRRRILEFDRDPGLFGLQPFTGPQEKRHTLPPGGTRHKLHGDECRSPGVS